MIIYQNAFPGATIRRFFIIRSLRLCPFLLRRCCSILVQPNNCVWSTTMTSSPPRKNLYKSKGFFANTSSISG